MGRVYKRGRTWWIQYYHQGNLFRESSRSPQKSVATSLLKSREGGLIDGRLPNLRADRTTFEDLAELFLQDYQVNERKTLNRAHQLVDRLKESFAKFRAHAITSQNLADYIARRQQEGMTNATINRELGALKRMFTLAMKQTPPLVQAYSTPQIPHLRENNIRTGFFSEEEYLLLRAALPDYLKIPFVIGYWTGMRRGEILGLQWNQVDLDLGFLRLEPGTTKNGRGRTVPLANDLLVGLQQWWKSSRLQYPQCEWVCHYQGNHLKGIPRKRWERICQQVGLPRKLFHDLRRTGVRNLVRAGISERVAMEISGHRTRSVFDRYNIVSQQDLLQAQARLNQMSTISSTVGNITDLENLLSY